MTSFRKLWSTFIDTLKPRAVREAQRQGLHAIFVDTRPFNISSSTWER